MSSLIDYPLFVFLGPPGSGKGTLASKLSERLNLPHLSTGDLLRSYIQKETQEAKELASYLAQGKLAPPELFMKIFTERLCEPESQNGLILDGYPRTIAQAQFLDQQVMRPDQIVFIHVQLSDEQVIRRLSGRRLCQHCQKTYHVEFSKPLQENQCDRCQHALITRNDDQKEVIQKRLELFHISHTPICHYYQDRPFWFNIEAIATPEECALELFNQLEKRLPETLTNAALTSIKETP